MGDSRVKVLETPLVYRTDKMEIRVYRQAKEVAFYPLTIRLGQVVPAPHARFRLRFQDFQHYPKELLHLGTLLCAWAGPQADKVLKARASMEMPARAYLQQSHAIE